ncbi:MAG: transporter [Clostridiales bacterium]|nr:transporter [Clostridiales bacterium]
MNTLSIYKSKIIKAAILLFALAILLQPAAAYEGASFGLLLWFHNLLPSLLPFIILSNLMVKLDIARKISKVFYPVLGRLFGISSEGCYPILFGFLSGIPMGAKATADLVRENRLNRRQAQFLIGMCNNASPMFVIGYISISQLKLPSIKYALLAIIYGSAILSALIWRFLSGLYQKNKTGDKESGKSDSEIIVPKKSSRFSFELLDSCIMNGFETITRIGGYVILFNILAQMLKVLGGSSGIIKAIGMGLLEITTGISQLCSLDIDYKIKIVLTAALSSFGGLSGIAQTKSVLQDSRLSISSYLAVKLMHALLAGIISLLYVFAGNY